MPAPALRDWIVPRLTGERPAGTPSLTSVFGLIGRDLRAAHESAQVLEPETDPPEEPVSGGPPKQTLTPGDRPPLALSKLRGICGSMSAAGTYGSDYWRRPCIW